MWEGACSHIWRPAHLRAWNLLTPFVHSAEPPHRAIPTRHPAHRQDPPRLQLLGRRRDHGRLRPALHPQVVSQMVGAAYRQHRPGRGVIPGAGGHRRGVGPQLRLHQHLLGDPHYQPGDLPHRPAHQLLRRALWRGHGPADPWRRLRLYRLHHHFADLRQLHLSVLRPGSGDHGPGAGAVFPYPAGLRLCDLLAAGDPAGGLWRDPDQPPATVDSTAVAVVAGIALWLRVVEKPRRLQRLDQLCRAQRRWRWFQPAGVLRRLHRGAVAGDADR